MSLSPVALASLSRAVNMLFGLLKLILAILMIGTLALVSLNVLLRYGFNSGINISSEASRWGLVWMTFIAAVIAMREGGDIGVSFIRDALPPRLRRLVDIGAQILMLCACWMILGGSWSQAVINLNVNGSTINLSTGVFYFSAGIFFGALSIPILVHQIYRTVFHPEPRI